MAHAIQLTQLDKKILDTIQDGIDTSKAISDYLGITRKRTRTGLINLVKSGLIMSTKGESRQVYGADSRRCGARLEVI